MWLRDASAYNVQFDGGRPILIDSLSFEVADLSAGRRTASSASTSCLLALMAHRDPRCGLMLREFIDGLPLDLATSLLPGRTRRAGCCRTSISTPAPIVARSRPRFPGRRLRVPSPRRPDR